MKIKESGWHLVYLNKIYKKSITYPGDVFLIYIKEKEIGKKFKLYKYNVTYIHEILSTTKIQLCKAEYGNIGDACVAALESYKQKLPEDLHNMVLTKMMDEFFRSNNSSAREYLKIYG